MSGLKLRSPKSAMKKARVQKELGRNGRRRGGGPPHQPLGRRISTPAVAEAAREREYYQVSKFAFEKALGPGPGQ